jgi:hypothetical protein
MTDDDITLADFQYFNQTLNGKSAAAFLALQAGQAS